MTCVLLRFRYSLGHSALRRKNRRDYGYASVAYGERRRNKTVLAEQPVFVT